MSAPPDVLAHLRRMTAWTAWADRETLGSLHAAGAPPPRALRWMGHVVGAQRLWLARIQGVPSPLAGWPELSLERCAAESDAVSRDWRAYVDALTVECLEDRISYRTSGGEAFTSTVAEILTHVSIHSAYHRGQIAAELRAQGHEAVLTDFIHAVRTGRLG